MRSGDTTAQIPLRHAERRDSLQFRQGQRASGSLGISEEQGCWKIEAEHERTSLSAGSGFRGQNLHPCDL